MCVRAVCSTYLLPLCVHGFVSGLHGIPKRLLHDFPDLTPHQCSGMQTVVERWFSYSVVLVQGSAQIYFIISFQKSGFYLE